jgi:hypothetical protein
MRLPWHEVQNLDLLSGMWLKAGESACPTGDLFFAAVIEQRPDVDEPATARLSEQFTEGDQFIDLRPAFASRLVASTASCALRI